MVNQHLNLICFVLITFHCFFESTTAVVEFDHDFVVDCEGVDCGVGIVHLKTMAIF